MTVSCKFTKIGFPLQFDYLIMACSIVPCCISRTKQLHWRFCFFLLFFYLILPCRYSCFYHHVCSLWISFGVYVTGILFQTVTFVSFLLISNGYCIMCERLSIQERRITAALGCIFYLTHVGYRASVPYFSVSLLGSSDFKRVLHCILHLSLYCFFTL